MAGYTKACPALCFGNCLLVVSKIELYRYNVCFGYVFWVASAPSSSRSVAAKFVWTGKCAYLRVFSTKYLIKHSKKFDLDTGSQSIATHVIVTK